MKKLAISLLVLFSLLTPLAYGGEGHDHGNEPAKPISEVEAGKKAAEFVKNFSKKGKLPESWGFLKAATIEQRTFKKPEWVITFKNPEETNTDKQTLYIFLSLSGHFLGANFSGK